MSAKLTAVEARLAQIERFRAAAVQPKVRQFTDAEIREFMRPKSTEFAEILAGEADIAREYLRRHIKKLVLTPKQIGANQVFEVSGDISLFQESADDVMLTNSLEGIAEHYIGASISLAGVILDPSLPLAA